MYCRNCGKQIEDRAEICTNCGVRIISKPSNFWYILPLLFNILGGIIGYYALRNKDRSMAKNMIYLGIGMIILLTISSIASNESDKSTDTTTKIYETQKSNIATPTQTVSRQANINDDIKFIEWATDSSIRISSDLSILADAMSSADLNRAKILAQTLEEDSEKYYLEIDEFKISDKFQSTKSNYKRALESFNYAAKYTISAIEYNNAEELKKAIEYMNMGNSYIKLATTELNSLK